MVMVAVFNPKPPGVNLMENGVVALLVNEVAVGCVIVNAAALAPEIAITGLPENVRVLKPRFCNVKEVVAVLVESTLLKL